MSKPLHQELLEQDARAAPEADSAEELSKRVVQHPAAVGFAGAIAVGIAALHFLGVVGGFAPPLALLPVVTLAGALWGRRREKGAATAADESTGKQGP